MATETLSAIKLWYSAKFPELKDNDLYIAGNFYGGRTVPKVALAIHNYNQEAETKLPLKGAYVGNGLTNYTYDGAQSAIEFSYYRGFLDTETWDEVVKHECDFTAINVEGTAKPAICDNYYSRWVGLTLAARMNPFNVYAKCVDP